MKKTIKKAFKWFVLSSQNPQLVSRTVKGLFIVGLSQVNDMATQLGVTLPYNVEHATEVVSLIAFYLGLALFVWGFSVKVQTTLSKNETGQ